MQSNNVIRDTDFFYRDLNFFYRFLDQESVLIGDHSHNFYEYFFITSGEIIHHANGKKVKLIAGDLLFVRPDDCHGYIVIEGKSCDIINVSFRASIFTEICKYIGFEIIKSKLVDPLFPPLINLSHFKESSLEKEHELLNYFAGENEEITVRLKIILVEVIGLFIKHFTDNDSSRSKNAFETALEKMNSQENIEEGIGALQRVTGFSHGHLCSVMKKHLGVTPSQYILELRLIYASNLLINSEFDVLNISLKVGYSSVSHFIKIFKKKFGMPPLKYRRKYRK